MESLFTPMAPKTENATRLVPSPNVYQFRQGDREGRLEGPCRCVQWTDVKN